MHNLRFSCGFSVVVLYLLSTVFVSFLDWFLRLLFGFCRFVAQTFKPRCFYWFADQFQQRVSGLHSDAFFFYRFWFGNAKSDGLIQFVDGKTANIIAFCINLILFCGFCGFFAAGGEIFFAVFLSGFCQFVVKKPWNVLRFNQTKNHNKRFKPY